jgi:orotate phosphoribosyltransferase
MKTTEPQNIRNALKQLLTKLSFQYNEKPVFSLVSGKKSNFYIDCKMTTLYSRSLPLIGELMYDLIRPLNIRGIGGLTLGADPIAVATALIAGQKGKDLISFVIRKEPKRHGLMKFIEGRINAGDRVVIIDDVITTGGSTIKAIEIAEKSNLQIAKVLVLVDRQEGGKENIIKKGYQVEAVFTTTDLMKESKRLNL